MHYMIVRVSINDWRLSYPPATVLEAAHIACLPIHGTRLLVIPRPQKEVLQRSLWAFPLQHTSLYSPPVIWPVFSQECWQWQSRHKLHYRQGLRNNLYVDGNKRVGRKNGTPQSPPTAGLFRGLSIYSIFHKCRMTSRLFTSFGSARHDCVIFSINFEWEQASEPNPSR